MRSFRLLARRGRTPTPSLIDSTGCRMPFEGELISFFQTLTWVGLCYMRRMRGLYVSLRILSVAVLLLMLVAVGYAFFISVVHWGEIGV